MDSLTQTSYKVMIDEEEGMSTKLRQLVMAGLIQDKKDLPYFKSALKKIKGGTITTVVERQILINVLQQFLGMVDEAPEFFNLLRRQLSKSKNKKKEVKKEEFELAFEQVAKRRADKRNSETSPHKQGSSDEGTPGQVNEQGVEKTHQERQRDAWYQGDDHYAAHKKANPTIHAKVPVKKKGLDIPKGHLPPDKQERDRAAFYAKKEGVEIPDNIGHSTKVKKKTASPTTTVVKNPDYKESVDYGFTSFKEWRAQKSEDAESVGEGITGDDDANERALDKNRAMAKKYGQVRQGIPPEDKEKKKREAMDKENTWRRAQRANRKASGIVRQD